jgi:hypothetical protein
MLAHHGQPGKGLIQNGHNPPLFVERGERDGKLLDFALIEVRSRCTVDPLLHNLLKRRTA